MLPADRMSFDSRRVNRPIGVEAWPVGFFWNVFAIAAFALVPVRGWGMKSCQWMPVLRAACGCNRESDAYQKPANRPVVPLRDVQRPDDLGRFRVCRETDENEADRETVIRGIMSGQYGRPIRVVAFNSAEGYSRDKSLDIAGEIVDPATQTGERLSKHAQAFVEWATGEDLPTTLRVEDGQF